MSDHSSIQRSPSLHSQTADKIEYPSDKKTKTYSKIPRRAGVYDDLYWETTEETKYPSIKKTESEVPRDRSSGGVRDVSYKDNRWMRQRPTGFKAFVKRVILRQYIHPAYFPHKPLPHFELKTDENGRFPLLPLLHTDRFLEPNDSEELVKSAKELLKEFPPDAFTRPPPEWEIVRGQKEVDKVVRELMHPMRKPSNWGALNVYLMTKAAGQHPPVEMLLAWDKYTEFKSHDRHDREARAQYLNLMEAQCRTLCLDKARRDFLDRWDDWVEEQSGEIYKQGNRVLVESPDGDVIIIKEVVRGPPDGEILGFCSRTARGITRYGTGPLQRYCQLMEKAARQDWKTQREMAEALVLQNPKAFPKMWDQSISIMRADTVHPSEKNGPYGRWW
ncbi:hypothetical protein F5Y18DRAFT_435330 [Xylariaceae sp. FL1019]|nr:hypothetical protein F5Y18DRAFT_435330 [Xylariaceae sp. FL1019]